MRVGMALELVRIPTLPEPNRPDRDNVTEVLPVEAPTEGQVNVDVRSVLEAAA